MPGLLSLQLYLDQRGNAYNSSYEVGFSAIPGKMFIVSVGQQVSFCSVWSTNLLNLTILWQRLLAMKVLGLWTASPVTKYAVRFYFRM